VSEEPKGLELRSWLTLREEYIDAVTKARSSPWDANSRGHPVPFPSLTPVIGKTFQPGLHVVIGDEITPPFPLTLQTASAQNGRALYVSTEMSRIEFFRRSLLFETGWTSECLRTLEFPRPQQQTVNLQSELPANGNRHLFHLDAYSVAATVESILSAALNLSQPGLATEEATVVVIDSLRNWAESLYPGLAPHVAFQRGIADAVGLSLKLDRPVLVAARRYNLPIAPGSVESDPGTRSLRANSHTLLTIEPDYDNERDDNLLDVALTVHRNVMGVAGQRLRSRQAAVSRKAIFKIKCSLPASLLWAAAHTTEIVRLWSYSFKT
jgi:hypothetical protein